MFIPFFFDSVRYFTPTAHSLLDAPCKWADLAFSSLSSGILLECRWVLKLKGPR